MIDYKSEKFLRIAGILTVIACCLLVFAQTVKFGFIDYDDDEYVFNNPNITRGLNVDSVKWAFTNVHGGNWHPLTTLSHMLDVTLFGVKPGPMHAVNTALHTFAAVLVFLFFYKVTRYWWVSLVCACLFAVHPLRAESVAWISERKDVLSLSLMMATLLLYARYVEKPSVKKFGLVCMTFALGLMAKPMLVTLPIVMLILDFWPFSRMQQGKKWTALAIEKIPLFALSLASAAATIWAQKATNAVKTTEQFEIGVRLANAAYSTVAYVVKAVELPPRLSVFYPHPGTTLPESYVVASIAAIVAAVAIGYVLRRKHPYFLAGILIYLVMLLPVIGIVQVGIQGMADRYTYHTQIFLLMGVLLLIVKTFNPYGMLEHSLMGLVMFYGFFGHWEVKAWQNSEKLFLKAIANTENNAVAHNNLAVYYLTRGEDKSAKVQLQAAIEINPRYAEALSNLGIIELSSGNWKEALEIFEGLVDRFPANVTFLTNYALCLSEANRMDDAEAVYQRILEISPRDLKANTGYTTLLLKRSDKEKAESQLRKIISYHPADPVAYARLIDLLREKRQTEQIEALFKQATQNVKDERPYLAYSLSLLDVGRPQDALAVLEEAKQRYPKSSGVYLKLALVHVQSGDTQRALENLRKSVALDPANDEAALGLAQMLAQTGNADDSYEAYEKGLEAKPHSIILLNGYAWTIAISPNPTPQQLSRALVRAKNAARLTEYRDPSILDTLAAIYARDGDFENAVKSSKKAISVALEKNAPSEHISEYRYNLDMYLAGKPPAPLKD